jgi:hypothetical protein
LALVAACTCNNPELSARAAARLFRFRLASAAAIARRRINAGMLAIQSVTGDPFRVDREAISRSR